LANRSKDRRGRSRKRRPAAAPQPQQGAAKPDASGAASGARGASRARAAREAPKVRKPRSSPTAPSYGERPPAPWHPLPLSELLILVGAIAVVIGVRNGVSNAGATLLVGIAAVAIGTFEVTIREHRSGYRSHTVMLALLPVLVFDSLVVLVVSAITTAPRLLSVALLAIDIVLFAFLFRLLRARFLDARHARVLREG
jgi:uncharacterized membrane protein YgdD (TMEM256/DUF423 family)